MPGAALEAPETFQFLPAPLGPRLPVAVGYQGAARWVALSVSSDHAMYHDGVASGTGDTGLLLAFKRHPTIAPYVAGAHLGSAVEEASEWLLVDRQHQALYLADCEEARRFLAGAVAALYSAAGIYPRGTGASASRPGRGCFASGLARTSGRDCAREPCQLPVDSAVAGPAGSSADLMRAGEEEALAGRKAPNASVHEV